MLIHPAAGAGVRTALLTSRPGLVSVPISGAFPRSQHWEFGSTDGEEDDEEQVLPSSPLTQLPGWHSWSLTLSLAPLLPAAPPRSVLRNSAQNAAGISHSMLERWLYKPTLLSIFVHIISHILSKKRS